jgi:5'-methylthioadenosine phosphorylase
MTAMPEAKLAREAELPYALVNLVTDYDAWRPAPNPPKGGEPAPAKAKHELLQEIIGNLKVASENAMALVKAAVTRIGRDPSVLAHCPASDALELAIWSDKAKLDADEVEKLRPIWGRYFPGR